MTVVSAVWPALGATLALVIFVLGYRQFRGNASEYLDADDLILLHEERRREASGKLSLLERLAGRFVPTLRRLIGPRGTRWLQRQIDQAGRPEGITVDGLLRRVAWWLILLLPVMVLALLQGSLLLMLMCPIMALTLPIGRVAAASRGRRESIDRDLPDFLDILAVTVSAGIAFRAALARVAQRFEGPLAEEVRLALDQLTHGAPLRVAFLQMQSRSGSVAMEQFVRAFLQSEELGAPLAETLNQIALDMRRSNAQLLRRKAAETAPRVTLVTSLVLVPGALLLVIVGMFLGANVDLSSITGGLEP